MLTSGLVYRGYPKSVYFHRDTIYRERIEGTCHAYDIVISALKELTAVTSSSSMLLAGSGMCVCVCVQCQFSKHSHSLTHTHFSHTGQSP